MDYTQIAAAIVSTLAPFLPYLVEVGKESGKKIAEILTEKGTEAAWEKAKRIWNKLKGYFGDAPAVQGAAMMMAEAPEDEFNQTALAKTLGTYLQKNPALGDELLKLLGGPEAVQEVLADKASWVQRVEQSIEGSGRQIVKSTDHSVATDVRQTIKKR